MKVTEIAAKPKEQKILRVAAYARVSTDKDAAFHSLEAQKDYYEKYVSRHPDWKLVAVYSDNGISGTTINRPAFQEMLEDCRNGKIDLIITKSVSRFARNVVILLETMRELKALGIDIFFEKDNMHSISPDGELLLTLIAMYAEEEARSVSENQKWRVQKRFEQGKLWTTNMLGYRLVDGELEVVPEEAEIVRQIYTDFLSGMKVYQISKKYQKSGIKTRFVKEWSETAINGILTNIKYTGNLILQKYYCIDFRTKINKVNDGELPRYYVRDSHEAIIDRDTFDNVQQEMARRREMRPPRRTADCPYLFSKMIKCGICGRYFIHHHYKYKQNSSDRWICGGSARQGKSYCPAQSVLESVLMEKTSEILGKKELTRDLLQQNLQRIEILEDGQIRYVMKDGTVSDIFWEIPPRCKRRPKKKH